jgi:hypothetical protein
VVIVEAEVALETDFQQLGLPLLHLFVDHLEHLGATELIFHDDELLS